MNESPENLGLTDWTNIEPLLNKAIDFPFSITQEEKHQIAEWIPCRKEMETRVQKHLNRSLDDLFHLAATHRDSLTYSEFLMIHQGFHLLNILAHTGREIRLMHRA